ncbi:hypothetical protein [Parapedomonas caeni]
MNGQKLLMHVERVILDHNIAPSRFGRDALNDPRLVFDLRRGRRIKSQNRRKISQFIAKLATREP